MYALIIQGKPGTNLYRHYGQTAEGFARFTVISMHYRSTELWMMRMKKALKAQNRKFRVIQVNGESEIHYPRIWESLHY